MIEDLQKRVKQLEEISSHQEHLLHQLNQVILDLRAEQDKMRSRLKDRIDQLESRLENESNELDPNERPPHY